MAANLARLGERMGVSVLPKALLTAGLGIGAAGPVVLHVGVALFTYEPTEGVTYEPTDGATDDPYPESPACASAAVLERAKAVANAIVLSFMRYPSCCIDKCTVCLIVPLNLLKRDKTPSGSHLADPGAMAFHYYLMSTSVDLTGTIAVQLGASVGHGCRGAARCPANGHAATSRFLKEPEF